MNDTKSGFPPATFFPVTATVRPVEAEAELRRPPDLMLWSLPWWSTTIKEAVEELWSISNSSIVVTTTLFPLPFPTSEDEAALVLNRPREREACIRIAKVTMIMTIRTPATIPKIVSIMGSKSIWWASPSVMIVKGFLCLRDAVISSGICMYIYAVCQII